MSPKLIVALDVDTLKEANRIVDLLYPTVKLFKVGSQLFTAHGQEAIKIVTEKGGQVFLDLKFHDIPNTVFSGVYSGTGLNAIYVPSSTVFPNIGRDLKNAAELSVFMMTVHTKGGMDMLREAVRGAIERAKELDIAKPFVVGVTRLTSDEDSGNIKEEVVNAAGLAKEAGLDGVVCSVNEVADVRQKCGKNFIIVTPGIRPKDYPADDQKRKATANEAAAAGANYIVVGRPILKADDPRKAAEEIIADCKG